MEKEGGGEYNLCKVRENNPQGASENVVSVEKEKKNEWRSTDSAAEDKLHVNRQ